MIKLLKTTDLMEILDLFHYSVKEMINSGIDQWDEEYPNEDIINNDLINSNGYGFYIDGKIVSYMAINELYDVEYNDINWKYDHNKSLVMHRLTVHPQYYKRGIAKNMLLFLENYIVESGHTGVRLDTFSKNPGAISLYRKFQYLEAGYVNFRKGKFIVFEKSMY